MNKEKLSSEWEGGEFEKSSGKGGEVAYLCLGVVHGLLDERDGRSELEGDVLGHVLLDHAVHGLEDTDLTPPSLWVVEALPQDNEDLPRRLGRAKLDERVDRRLGVRLNAGDLVVGEVKERLERRQEHGLSTRPKVDDQSAQGDGRVQSVLLRLGRRQVVRVSRTPFVPRMVIDVRLTARESSSALPFAWVASLAVWSEAKSSGMGNNIRRRISRLLQPTEPLPPLQQPSFPPFSASLHTIELEASEADSCLYVGWKDRRRRLLLQYVDDVVAAGEKGDVDEMIERIKGEFVIDDRGNMDEGMLLGMVVKRDRARRTICLSQSRYLRDVLERFKMTDVKPVRTPMDEHKVGDRLSSPRSFGFLARPFRSAAGYAGSSSPL
jgi:hypothetical protein